MITIAGIAHAPEYWEETKALLDKINSEQKLSKVTYETTRESMEEIKKAPDVPKGRAAYYLGRLKKIPSIKTSRDNLTLYLLLTDYLQNKGTKIKDRDLWKELAKVVPLRKAIILVHRISGGEYTHLLLNYCKLHNIELIPIGKTAFKQIHKSPMHQALGEKELAREIKKNGAELNLVGATHARPIHILLKMAGVQTKLIFSHRRDRRVPLYNPPLVFKKFGKKAKYVTKSLRNKRIK